MMSSAKSPATGLPLTGWPAQSLYNSTNSKDDARKSKKPKLSSTSSSSSSASSSSAEEEVIAMDTEAVHPIVNEQEDKEL